MQHLLIAAIAAAFLAIGCRTTPAIQQPVTAPVVVQRTQTPPVATFTVAGCTIGDGQASFVYLDEAMALVDNFVQQVQGAQARGTALPGEVDFLVGTGNRINAVTAPCGLRAAILVKNTRDDARSFLYAALERTPSLRQDAQYTFDHEQARRAVDDLRTPYR